MNIQPCKLKFSLTTALFCSLWFSAWTSHAEEPVVPDLKAIATDQTQWEIFGIESPGFAVAEIAGKPCLERKGKSKDAVDGSAGAILKDRIFSEGTIEVDLKGYNRKQGSFVGVLFHAIDGSTYDAVYFRPFNFESTDSESKGHCVQYISPPEWRWNNLRKQKPQQFENAVIPTLKSEEWFHARIVVDGERVQVFVNDSQEPSLSVKKLNGRKEGRIGLFVTGQGAFANLKIIPKQKSSNKVVEPTR